MNYIKYWDFDIGIIESLDCSQWNTHFSKLKINKDLVKKAIVWPNKSPSKLFSPYIFSDKNSMPLVSLYYR